MTILDHTIVDKVAYTVNLSGKGQLIHALVDVEEDDDRQALERFLGLWNFQELGMIVKGMIHRRTIGMDMQSMVYPDNANWVEVGDGMDFAVRVEESAFNQLMVKLYDALIESVNETPADFASGGAWDQFLSDVETLRQRD